jgi:Ca2+-binding RTX toxin-like protein
MRWGIAPVAHRSGLSRVVLVATLFVAAMCAVAAEEARADPVIATAGDIACSASSTVTSDKCHQGATSNLMVGAGLSAVLPLGDAQYQNGTYSNFTKSYGPSWGRLLPITFPAAGNHEYKTSGAQGYFDYFDGVGAATGRAGDRDKGYYSFDVGTWHLIALNSSDHCIEVACGKGSAQETWLRADLAAHPASCTLAYWHHPRFNSGHDGNATFMDAMFQDLYNADADVVLGGHAHDYERFAPQDPNGKLDRSRGIRQFVVGTGGAFFTAFGSPKANSEVHNGSTYGVLMLTLHPASYDWRFVPEAGKKFTDSGTTACHGILPSLPRAQTQPDQAPLVHGPNSATCTITGTPGDDVLEGTAQNDVICGLGGNDLIRGHEGDDMISGGDGNDRILGGGGRDRLYGDAGNDSIKGRAGPDRVVGGRGRDRLFGGTGNDALRGSYASDLLRGQSGDDRLVGGGGRNRMYGDGGSDLLISFLNDRGGDLVRGGKGRDRAEANPGDHVRSARRVRIPRD